MSLIVGLTATIALFLVDRGPWSLILAIVVGCAFISMVIRYWPGNAEDIDGDHPDALGSLDLRERGIQ